MDVRRRLGRNVKAARRTLGLSQEEFAFECGLHRTYISGVERGIRNPTVTVLDKIARALKVPAGRLLDEPDEVGTTAAMKGGSRKAKPEGEEVRAEPKASLATNDPDNGN